MRIRNIFNNLSQCVFNAYKNNEKHLHELRYLFWECTQRCNLNCLHCGSDCTAETMVPDMPLHDFHQVILQVKEMIKPNSVTVAITGGEPLLRKDLADCGRILKENGFNWGIVTNGYSYTPEVHTNLLDAGMGSLTLSLDGLKLSHNWLRSNDESFDRAVAALGLITSSPRLKYDVVTCVNKKNINELNEFKEFLISSGVKDWRIFTIFPVGRAAGFPELQLSNEEFTYVLDFIRSTRKEKRILLNYGCEGFLGEYEMEVRDYFYQCHAGVNVASVLADGSISACPSIRANFHQGNIYKDNFIDVWNNRFQDFRNRVWAKKGCCSDCSMFRYCEGNGMHLHDDDGNLLVCHYKRIS